MKLLSILLAVVSAAGCEAPADLAKAEVDKEADDLTVQWTCADGAPNGDRCGTLAAEVGTPEFREKFAVHKCHGLTSEKCTDLYWKMLWARWADRYPMADSKEVLRKCDADPRACDDPLVLERYLLQSHNRNVEATARRRKAEIDAEARRRQAEAFAAGAAALAQQRTAICVGFASGAAVKTVVMVCH